MVWRAPKWSGKSRNGLVRPQNGLLGSINGLLGAINGLVGAPKWSGRTSNGLVGPQRSGRAPKWSGKAPKWSVTVAHTVAPFGKPYPTKTDEFLEKYIVDLWGLYILNSEENLQCKLLDRK